MSHQNQKRQEPWRSKERHYCAVCNVWMGSDRQSILLHEGGKKHKQAATTADQARVKAKQTEAAQGALIQQTLQNMEQAARTALVAHDLGRLASESAAVPVIMPRIPSAVPSSAANVAKPEPAPSSTVSKKNKQPPPGGGDSASKKEWEARKKQRLQASQQKTVKQEADTDDKPSRVVIRPDEGHYSLTDPTNDTKRTFLEGSVFGSLLQEGVPCQFWTGAPQASAAEKRLPHASTFWQSGLVVRLKQKNTVVDIAYLPSPDAQEESLKCDVALDLVRLELGADETLPETVEEARLLAMGGEEEIVNNDNGTNAEVQEETGLSGWSTVSIKRTSVRQEYKQERERLLQARKQAALKAAQQEKERESRKMQEAVVQNAEDSALGAYDVWNRTKEGYKGVDIHAEVKVDVLETGKKLAGQNGVVSFKKKKNMKKKQSNKRTTSADDDD